MSPSSSSTRSSSVKMPETPICWYSSWVNLCRGSSRAMRGLCARDFSAWLRALLALGGRRGTMRGMSHPRTLAWLLRLLIPLVVGFSLVGCAPAAPPPAPTQATKAAVTIHYGYSSAGAVNAPVILADTMGYFQEQGIAVDYVQFPSASEVIPSITRGAVD